MNLSDVDLARLGGSLIMLLVASITAGHARPIDTARDYYHPQDAEGELIKDMLLGVCRQDLIERWFGGDELTASKLVNRVVEHALAAATAA